MQTSESLLHIYNIILLYIRILTPGKESIITNGGRVHKRFTRVKHAQLPCSQVKVRLFFFSKRTVKESTRRRFLDGKTKKRLIIIIRWRRRFGLTAKCIESRSIVLETDRVVLYAAEYNIIL